MIRRPTFLLTFATLCASGCIAPLAKIYTVERVIDGDTIVLESGEIVRLIGVNCHEMNSRLKSRKLAAEAAKRFTEELVGGKKVRLEHDFEKKDNTGRTLAYVKSDGKTLNEELIKHGHARVYHKIEYKQREKYIQLEREAADRGVGIWASRGNQIRKALGRGMEKAAELAVEVAGDLVYVTNSGTKYHRLGCRYLKKSTKPRPKAIVILTHEPCKVCKPDEQ